MVWEAAQKRSGFEKARIERAIAKNPNTPPLIIKKLLLGYLLEVAQNPAIGLIVLEDFEILRQISKGKMVWGYLTEANTNLNLLKLLAMHPLSEIAVGAQTHRRLYKEETLNNSQTWEIAVAKLAFSDWERTFLTTMGLVPRTLQETLSPPSYASQSPKMWETEDEMALVQVVMQDSRLTETWRKTKPLLMVLWPRLFQAAGPFPLPEIGTNDLLNRLGNERDWTILADPNASIHTLTGLWKWRQSTHDALQLCLAARLLLSEYPSSERAEAYAIWEKFIGDEGSSIARFVMALHQKNSPIHLPYEWFLRLAFAQNKHTSIRLLDQLSRDGNKFTMQAAQAQQDTIKADVLF